MGALNAGILTGSRRAYVNGSGAAGAYSAGNDTTGDGTAGAPYASLAEALLEWYNAEPTPADHFQIALLSDSGDVVDYGAPAISSTNAPATDVTNAICYILGWKKSWADQDAEGVWTDIQGAEKPKAALNQSGAHNLKHVVMVDIVASASAGTYIMNHSSGTGDGFCHLVRCVLESGTYRINTGTSVQDQYVHACYFNDETIEYNGGNTVGNTMYVSNCYVKNLTNAQAILYRSQSFSTFPIHTIGCYILNTTNSQHVYKNSGNAGGGFIYNHEANHYVEVTGGTGYFAADSLNNSTYDTLADQQAAAVTRNVYSKSGSGVAVSNDDPSPLNDGSRLNDKGGYWPQTVDVSGRDLFKKDFLGYYYGDVKDPISVINGGLFSLRGVGPVQSLTRRTAPKLSLVTPFNGTAEDTPYVIFKALQDRDASGTGHIHIKQYNNPSLDTLLAEAMSEPITVGATNNKIDFDEGGGELTATLSSGDYSLATLITEIQTQMDTVGANTYTVTRNTTTESINVASTGNVTLLPATGTNAANSALVKLLGFISDTASGTSHDAENGIEDNVYVNETWEYSTDYVEGDNPTTGTWAALGTGLASDSGVAGTDGFPYDVATVFIRVPFKNINDPIQGTTFIASSTNGNLRTAKVG